MNPSMLAKLEQLASRHEEVGALLATAEIIGDNDRFRALSMEYAQLEPVARGYWAYRQVLDDLDEAHDMSRDSDPELRALAQDELLEAETRRAEQERALQLLLLPRDPHDAGNVFLEIRAGTGGDEAALFAGRFVADVRPLCRTARLAVGNPQRKLPASTAATRKRSPASSVRAPIRG